MDERTPAQLNMPFCAPYRQSAAPGAPLEGDLQALAKLLGVGADLLAGKCMEELIELESRSKLAPKRAEMVCAGKVELLIPLPRADGAVHWFLDRGQTVTDTDGNAFVEGLLVEVDELYRRFAAKKEAIKRYQKELTQTETVVSSLRVRAEQDSLTGLLNARTTRNLAEAYLGEREKPCAMIIIDVDDFKRVNDRYGHMVGDQVMTGAAAAIKKLFRANDIVGRIGGDEFLVLMEDVAKREILDLRCGQIVQSFHQVVCDQASGDTLRCSVGAVFSETPGPCYDELFVCADKAMYQSKNAGGDRFSIEVSERQTP